MTDKEIGQFSTYLADLCELDANDRQKLVALFPDFAPDLRRHTLDDAKAALRQVLKGKVPYGTAAKIGATLGVLDDQRKAEHAAKAKSREYVPEPDEQYRLERMRQREARPAWEALCSEDREHRLRMAGKDLGYEMVRGKWMDGNGLAIPASWVERRALLVFAEKLQTESVS